MNFDYSEPPAQPCRHISGLLMFITPFKNPLRLQYYVHLWAFYAN